jgi:signal transduction histidine kinase
MVAESGEVRWFHTGISPESDPHGVVALHGISVDVTTLKRAEEAARQMARFREDLVSMVSHDLRTPLTALLASAGALELALQRTPGPSPEDRNRAEHWVRAIVRTAERMERLINDLLDMAVLQAGHLGLSKASEPLAPVVREVADMVRPLADQKQVEFVLELDDALSAWVDRGRVSQVIGNLVGNAIKFTPEGGKVSLKLEPSADRVRFTVADSGPGIPPADLERVFDRFWRDGQRGGHVGAGLGLSIAKGIVEAHGGRIWAESAPGKGATFHFELPSNSEEVVSHDVDA